MKKIKLNDRVVQVSEKFLPWVNLPLFQRLKFISQLETVCLAYPGATQNRFQHSLGAYQLARTYIRYLHDNSPDVRIPDKVVDAFLFAVLYHDIGHSAFSHASDRTVAKNFYPGSKPHDEKRFDLLTELDVDFDKEIIGQIWRGKHYLSPLLNGPLSVDRMDFIGRDILYTGKSEFGVIPCTELMEYTYLLDGKIVYDVRRVGQYATFLNVRQSMYETVYFHHTSTAGSLVIDTLIGELAKHGLADLYCNNFEQLTDDYILNWVRFDKKLNKLLPLVESITTRRDLLPKRVWEAHQSSYTIEEPTLGKDEVSWRSPWIEGFDPKAFHGIFFKDGKELLCSTLAFDKYRITPTMGKQILRHYRSPLLCV